MLVLNVCKEDINWKPVQTKTGVKHYANIATDYLKDVDDKGNTHSVWNNQSQEERAEKKKKNYCGRGKEYAFTKKEYAQNQQEHESHPTDNSALPF
jgi:hypothetical protein